MITVQKRIGLVALAVATVILSVQPSHAREGFKQIDTLSVALKSNMLQALLSKELCTCIFSIRPGQVAQPAMTHQQKLTECMDVSNIPVPRAVLRTSLVFSVSSTAKTVKVVPRPIVGDVFSQFEGEARVGKFEGEQVGCRLLTEQELETLSSK